MIPPLPQKLTPFPGWKTAKAIREPRKGLRNECRLQKSEETCLGINEAASTTTEHPNTLAPVTTQKSIPVQLLMYHTRAAKVCVLNKFDGTKGFRHPPHMLYNHQCTPVSQLPLQNHLCPFEPHRGGN